MAFKVQAFLTVSSVFLPLLPALAVAQANTASTFTDAKSGIVFQRFSAQSASVGMALPEFAEDSFIGQISVPLSNGAGWGALGLNGAIDDGIFVVAYANGADVTGSLRSSDQSEIKGDYKIRTISESTSADKASLLYTFLCENCLDPALGGTLDGLADSATLGFGLSVAAVSDPTSTAATLGGSATGGNGTFLINLAAARNAEFPTWAALAAPVAPKAELKRKHLDERKPLDPRSFPVLSRRGLEARHRRNRTGSGRTKGAGRGAGRDAGNNGGAANNEDDAANNGGAANNEDDAANNGGAAGNNGDAANNEDDAANNEDDAANNNGGAHGKNKGAAGNNGDAANNEDDAANNGGAANNEDEAANNGGAGGNEDDAANNGGAANNEDDAANNGGAANNEDDAANNGGAANNEDDAANNGGAANNEDDAANNGGAANNEDDAANNNGGAAGNNGGAHGKNRGAAANNGGAAGNNASAAGRGAGNRGAGNNAATANNEDAAAGGHTHNRRSPFDIDSLPVLARSDLEARHKNRTDRRRKNRTGAATRKNRTGASTRKSRNRTGAATRKNRNRTGAATRKNKDAEAGAADDAKSAARSTNLFEARHAGGNHGGAADNNGGAAADNTAGANAVNNEDATANNAGAAGRVAGNRDAGSNAATANNGDAAAGSHTHNRRSPVAIDSQPVRANRVQRVRSFVDDFLRSRAVPVAELENGDDDDDFI